MFRINSGGIRVGCLILESAVRTDAGIGTGPLLSCPVDLPRIVWEIFLKRCGKKNARILLANPVSVQLVYGMPFLAKARPEP
jgi:hypothetical protein